MGLLELRRNSLGLHERPMSLLLIKYHGKESEDHNDPVQVVRNDGTDCCRVRPAEQSIEDTPPTASVDLWIAALHVVSIYPSL